MTKTAYLRVYSPDTPSSAEPVPGFVRSYAILSEVEGESNWTVNWQGRNLVCPRNLRLRVLESTVAFANAFGGLGVGIIPEGAARAADRELRQYQREYPGHRSHVLTSAWHVPIRWFSAFLPDEIEVYEDNQKVRIRYRVDLPLAKTRVREVLSVLQNLQVFHGPSEELAQLLVWLDQFPEESMVELDYADVSDLFDPQDLALDDSVELIRDSVDALAQGDMMRAGENYGRVVTRWANAFSVTFSS